MEIQDDGLIVWDDDEFDDMYKDRKDGVAAVLLPDLVWYPVDAQALWSDKFSEPKYGGYAYFRSNGIRYEVWLSSILAKRMA